MKDEQDMRPSAALWFGSSFILHPSAFQNGDTMQTDDVIADSETMQFELNHARRWEIHTRHGLDHRPEESLEEAVAAYRKRFRIPDAEQLAGTVQAWKNAAPAGQRRPLHVELASRAELRANAEANAPA
jgi:hypothetical protein